jgi:hypothetical protein
VGLLAPLLAAAALASSPTAVVGWSPLDSSGTLRPTLRVARTVRDGRCVDIGYTYVGGIAYRCGFRNFLLDSCFRDGPGPTDYVVCIERPWSTSVIRLRSPYLLLYPGVTFTGAAAYPWGVVLDDGNRCGVLQGAHDSLVARGRRWIVDYACERGDVVLMREGIVRGRVWQMNAARWIRSGGYTFLGPVPVRRVYFGALAPPLQRQNRLAHEAYETAKAIVHRRAPRVHLDLAWVRLALPEADWAYVIFTPANATGRGRFAVLHRAGATWADASTSTPYCTTLPKRVTRQLFLPRRAPRLVGAELAPRDETRC